MQNIPRAILKTLQPCRITETSSIPSINHINLLLPSRTVTIQYSKPTTLWTAPGYSFLIFPTSVQYQSKWFKLSSNNSLFHSQPGLPMQSFHQKLMHSQSFINVTRTLLNLSTPAYTLRVSPWCISPLYQTCCKEYLIVVVSESICVAKYGVLSNSL